MTICTPCGSARSSRIDFLDEQIDRLSDAIGEQIAPFGAAVELLCTIPGVQRRAAEVIISEIGTDMSVFLTAKQLASWAGQCPGNDQSAGKRRSGNTRKGSKWPDWTQGEAALVAVRSNLLAHAQHRRALPRPRRRLLPTPRPRTPNPNGSSNSWKRSDTPSRLAQPQPDKGQRPRPSRQPERYFPVRAGGGVAHRGARLFLPDATRRTSRDLAAAGSVAK